MKYLVIFLITIFLAVVLCCCVVPVTYSYFTHKNAEFEYGKGFNPQRVQMGIPIIPESWELWGVSGKRITWVFPQFSPTGDPAYPRYTKKQIVISDDNIVTETDYYEGLQEKVRSDGDRIRDEIEITCVYVPAEIKITECYARYATFERDSNVSREEAIEVLNEWGIQYP